MKYVITIISLLFCFAAFAQQDTTKTLPVTPPVSPLVGYTKFASFAIFDSLSKPVMRRQAAVTDTFSVSWGVSLAYCQECRGERIFVRNLHLKAPGLDQYIQAVPDENNMPGFDEAWQTSMGILYISLDTNGNPTQFLIKQENKFQLQWRNPIPKPVSAPK